MLNETIGERLIKFRKELGMTQADVAGIIGKTQSAVQKYEKNSNRIDETSLRLLNLKLRLNPEWVRAGRGDMLLTEEFVDKQKNVVYELPVYNYHRASSAGEATVSGNVEEYRATVDERFRAIHKDLFMVRIGDNELAPELRKGDYVVLSTKTKGKKDGFYLCILKGKAVLRYIQFREENAIVGLPAGPSGRGASDIIARVSLELIGRVVRLSRYF